MSELRFALRQLRRNPGFTLIAVLTLALGIGANTAVFSVVNGVLLQPLAHPEPERIVTVLAQAAGTGRETARLTGADYLDLREQSRSFSAIAYQIGGEMGVQVGKVAEFTGVYLVTPEYFSVFRVPPLAGRLFTSEEEGRAAVVSPSFAERHFGSVQQALGQKILFDQKPLDIVGVAPAWFRYPREANVWMAAPAKPGNVNRTAYNYPVLARLAPNVTAEAAQAELDVIAQRQRAEFPKEIRDRNLRLRPLREQLVGPVKTMLWFLLGAVSLVLLIACANVANLLLSRATSRSREFALRAAIGASHWRMIRQLLVESAVLGVAGGIAALVVVVFSLDALVQLAPNLPRMREVKVNLPVLAFTTLSSLGAAFLFGLFPALAAVRRNVVDGLKQEGARGVVGGFSGRSRQVLVVSEIALAVVLAIGAGLLFRSFLGLQAAELGYRASGLLAMEAHMPAQGLQGHLQAVRSYDELYGKLATVPGVQSVAGVMGLPASRYSSLGQYRVEGATDPERNPSAGFRLTSAGYFTTMGIPLRKGRDFDARDQYEANFVAIISESLAQQSFPNRDPLGQRIQCGLDSPNWMTVIGVVADVRHDSPAAAPAPQLYMPLAQHPFRANELHVVMRTTVQPASLAPVIEGRMREWQADTPVKFITMEGLLSDSVALPRFRTLLLGLFAILALGLAMAGIYGVMSYLATQRTAEMGLRMALGAAPGDVVWLMLRQAMVLLTVGLAAGFMLAAAASKVIGSMLYGLRPTDAVTYTGVALLVVAVAMLAALGPAWRASRVSPVESLR